MIQEAYVQRISTRPVEDPVKAVALGGHIQSQVSHLCDEVEISGAPFS